MNKKNIILAIVIILITFSLALLFTRFNEDTSEKLLTTSDISTGASTGDIKKEIITKLPDDIGIYLADISKNPAKFSSTDISQFPIKNINDLAEPLNTLRESNPEIAEQFLTQDTFKVYADPKTSLEGYIYEQFQNNKPFDPVMLKALPIKTDSDLQVILREIYMKKPERFPEFSGTILERFQDNSTRRLAIVYKMLNYVNKTTDPADMYSGLSSQKDFFYKWPGWEVDLTNDEKPFLYEGKKFLDRFGTFKKKGDIVDVNGEIKNLEEFLGRYEKTQLPSFYVGTINLYIARAYLYAINGDINKAISIMASTKELTHKFVKRKEQFIVASAPGLVPVEAIEGRLYWIRGQQKEKSGDKAGALQDYKKAEELIHHNLLANPFGLLDTFAFWRDLKDTIKKMEG